MKKLFVPVAVAAAMLAAAPAANADTDTAPDTAAYLNLLNSNGGRPITALDGPLIAQGFNFCAMIRGGMPVDQVKAQSFGPLVNTPAMVDAAQQALCPDTLN